MSGECVSYNINKRVTWQEFNALPDDIKRLYIKNIRQKYDVSDLLIAKMIGAPKTPFGFEVRRLWIGQGKHTRGRTRPENKVRFYRDFGMELEAESVPCEAVEIDDSNECAKAEYANDVHEVIATEEKQSEEKNAEFHDWYAGKPSFAIPERCTFVFDGSVRDAFRSLEAIIGSGSGVLTVTFTSSENGRTSWMPIPEPPEVDKP